VVTLVLDAIYNLAPTDAIRADIERLQLPAQSRYLFGGLKLAAAAGLLVGARRPAFGRLTARALVLYFVCALGAHVRIKDRAARYAPAAAMLGWSAVATRAFD
jgi:hypothetical protein